MRDFLVDAAANWLGMLLLLLAAAAVLCVDIGRELVGDERRWWISVIAFVVVPLLVFAAGVATVVRIFTLA